MANVRDFDPFFLFAAPTGRPYKGSNLLSYDLQSSVGKPILRLNWDGLFQKFC